MILKQKCWKIVTAQLNLNKIDECDVPYYNQFDLNKSYYQNPGKVIPILETVINAPTTDKKKSINKMLKFKNIIRQNKTLGHSKVKFYLDKYARKLKTQKCMGTKS